MSSEASIAALQAARDAGLKWVSDTAPGFHRKRKGGRFVYIDDNGKTVITPQYDFADSFNHGEAYVIKDSKTFYIDKQNKVVHQ